MDKLGTKEETKKYKWGEKATAKKKKKKRITRNNNERNIQAGHY